MKISLSYIILFYNHHRKFLCLYVCHYRIYCLLCLVNKERRLTLDIKYTAISCCCLCCLHMRRNHWLLLCLLTFQCKMRTLKLWHRKTTFNQHSRLTDVFKKQIMFIETYLIIFKVKWFCVHCTQHNYCVLDFLKP